MTPATTRRLWVIRPASYELDGIRIGVCELLARGALQIAGALSRCALSQAIPIHIYIYIYRERERIEQLVRWSLDNIEGASAMYGLPWGCVAVVNKTNSWSSLKRI